MFGAVAQSNSGKGAPSQSDFRKCGRRDNRRWIDIRRCQQCRNNLREPKHTRLRGQRLRRHVRHQSERELELDYTVSSGTTVQFDGTTGTLQIDDFADGAETAGQQDFNAAIAGLQVGDLIQISASGLGNYINGIDGASPEAYDLSTQTTTLDLTDGGTEVAALTLDGDYSASMFDVTTSDDGNYIDINDETAPCYCAGTLIMTALVSVRSKRLASATGW